MSNEWDEVIRWVNRQIDRYGGIVYEGSTKYDWGQALARQVYGKDWVKITDAYYSEDVPDKVLTVIRNKTHLPWVTKVEKDMYWVKTGLWCE